MAEHPRLRIDPVIHQPLRFSVMAVLAESDEAEFRFVRDTVQTTDSSLSKAVSALEEVGYVDVKKGFVGKYPRTRLRLTREGRTAFDAHVETLREIISGAQ